MSALPLACWYKVPPSEERHPGTLIELVSIVDDIRACVIASDGQLLVLDPTSLTVGTPPVGATVAQEERALRARAAFRRLAERSAQAGHAGQVGYRFTILCEALADDGTIAWLLAYIEGSTDLDHMPAIPPPF